MATIQLGPYRAVTTVMSTELNSLAATSGKAITAVLDNGTDLDVFDDVELAVTFGVAPTAGTVVELYLVPSIDGGVKYADGSTTVLPPSNLYIDGFAVRSVITLQRMIIRGVPLPPGNFKYLVQNTTNQAFPASGSTLRRSPYQLQSL